jgi:predicted PurR-regulated permease PerM
MPLERSRLQRYTFLVLFALALYAFWRTIEPIWVPVFLGMIIAVGVHPMHEKLLKRLGGKRPGIAAAMSTMVVMIFVVGLLAFLLLVVGHRVIGLAQDISTRYQDKGAMGLLGHDVTGLLGRMGLQRDDIRQRVAQAAAAVAEMLSHGATSIVTGLFSVIFVFTFTAITSYYFLREGRDGTHWLVEIIPLPNGQVAQIVDDVRDVTRAMLMSTGVMSAYQAVVAGIGYWLLGVDSPLVWASLTGIASILPAVGTALVWAPIGVVLMASGHLYKGIGVLLWGLFAVVFVADYVLRPRLVGTRIKMSELLVFCAIFGGIEAFGILGLVLGPIAVAVLLSLIRIYQREYRPEGPVRSADPTKANGTRPQIAP